ncbi:MAG TPA: response regulator [Anaerolineaceae bacterium]
MKSILFVDDDLEMILSTRRLLYALHRDWQVVFSNSGADALARLSEKNFDVIISDIRMPGISGIELLDQVRKRFPHMVRIALSGHSDRETSLKASGLAHQYLAKPSPAETIIAAIECALSAGSLIVDDNIRQVIGKLKTIPSQPKVYMDLVNELKNPDSSLACVGEIISKDASMSAKVLQLVNSAFFGLPQKVVDPTQAATFLGVETIRDLVLGIGIFAQFDQRKLSGLSISNLWNHSLRSSTLAKAIAIHFGMDKKICNSAMVAGLLHDIGKLVLADNFPQQYQVAHQSWLAGDQPFEVYEYQIFKATHAQIGAYLLSLWGLPGTVSRTVGWHHNPSGVSDSDRSVMLCVHAANVLDYQRHPDVRMTAVAPTFNPDFLKTCNLEDQMNIWQSIK